MSTPVTIYTDGGCRGNPGPGGWGAVLLWGEHRKELNGSEALTTNNRMELLAAIEGLKFLNRDVAVRLYTDSQYVKQGITQWIRGWKKNGWQTASKQPVKNKDLWQELDQLMGRYRVSWHWVKGHSGDPMNELADRLANHAMDKMGKS
ncbi:MULTISPECIES: ribonuclease HI [Reinekea]|jgi:ribonuclease HI|uniref:Ribonuclease H n=1 Tax=Reinekea forsetii TaxID=1336806 RepID=A0A2K8KRZ7_9GAMM|nr:MULTISPECIES: ribonuclease HI [Reinekea]ATX76849.1 ribonuclease HI [Reinekea forsetii]MDO7645853.1 ribonuclease HI [Reinekea forsetii]